MTDDPTRVRRWLASYGISLVLHALVFVAFILLSIDIIGGGTTEIADPSDVMVIREDPLPAAEASRRPMTVLSKPRQRAVVTRPTATRVSQTVVLEESSPRNVVPPAARPPFHLRNAPAQPPIAPRELARISLRGAPQARANPQGGPMPAMVPTPQVLPSAMPAAVGARATPVATAAPTAVARDAPMTSSTLSPPTIIAVTPAQAPSMTVPARDLTTASPSPTRLPTSEPSVAPSAAATEPPTASPTQVPSALPTQVATPVSRPTSVPTGPPTVAPTRQPAISPTAVPVVQVTPVAKSTAAATSAPAPTVTSPQPTVHVSPAVADRAGPGSSLGSRTISPAHGRNGSAAGNGPSAQPRGVASPAPGAAPSSSSGIAFTPTGPKPDAAASLNDRLKRLAIDGNVDFTPKRVAIGDAQSVYDDAMMAYEARFAPPLDILRRTFGYIYNRRSNAAPDSLAYVYDTYSIGPITMCKAWKIEEHPYQAVHEVGAVAGNAGIGGAVATSQNSPNVRHDTGGDPVVGTVVFPCTEKSYTAIRAGSLNGPLSLHPDLVRTRMPGPAALGTSPPAESAEPAPSPSLAP